MSRLAHAGDNDVPIRGHDEVSGLFDGRVQTGFQLLKGFAFNANYIARNIDVAFTGHVCSLLLH